MIKIGTHNSGTGEAGRGLLSWLVTPFARCQSKTIVEQYEAGCRYFDLRVRKNKDGVWVFAHGLWTSKKRLSKVLKYLNRKADTELVYVNICYEGSMDAEIFGKTADKWVKRYNRIRWLCASVKKPEWVNARVYNGVAACDHFANLSKARYMWLPVPYIWYKIKGQGKFNEQTYTMVDFL